MFSYAIKEIKRRKLRTASNIAGYSIAVAFLIIAVSIAQAYTVVASGTLLGIGTHFVVYIPASKDCPCQFGEVGPYFAGTYTPTFNSSLINIVKSLSGVADAAPALIFKLENLTICGIDIDNTATSTTAVAPNEVVQGKGRYLVSTDTNGVMLDEIFANEANLEPGDKFTAFDQNLTVVGIVNPRLHSKPAGGADIYAPLTVVQKIAKNYGDTYGFAVKEINLVLVEVSNTGDSAFIGTVEQSVLRTVEAYGSQKGAIVGYQCGFAARKVASVTETSAWTVSSILLVSVMLFSLKSQFSAVAERTKEIGILKAIGWADKDITKQVFIESLIQGAIGGIIGVSIGYLTILLIPQLGLVSTQNLVLTISPYLTGLALAISIGAGTIAGIFPAWIAAKLQPAEALRRF